jgi:F-box domain
MTSRLTSLPYEVLAYIVECISFDDVVSLSFASKQLQFLIREDNICKKVLEVFVPFSNGSYHLRAFRCLQAHIRGN